MISSYCFTNRRVYRHTDGKADEQKARARASGIQIVETG